jgi:hypothetical protein
MVAVAVTTVCSGVRGLPNYCPLLAIKYWDLRLTFTGKFFIIFAIVIPFDRLNELSRF